MINAMTTNVSMVWTSVTSNLTSINGLTLRVVNLENTSLTINDLTPITDRVTSLETANMFINNRVTNLETADTSINNSITAVSNRVTNIELSVVPTMSNNI